MVAPRNDGPDLDIPTTFEQFENAYRNYNGSVNPTNIAEIFVSSLDMDKLALNQFVRDQIRQHHHPHAKATTKPNPQNAAQEMQNERGMGFSKQAPHPLLKDYMAAINDVANTTFREEPAHRDALLNSFAKDRSAAEQSFNELRESFKNRLKQRLAQMPRPRPGSPRPEPR